MPLNLSDDISIPANTLNLDLDSRLQLKIDQVKQELKKENISRPQQNSNYK